MRKQLVALLGGLAVVGLTIPVMALDDSTGEQGIDVLRLHELPYDLLGRKIGIGQVEVGRPSKFGLDKAALNLPELDIAGVFHRDRPANSNTHVDPHAAMVALVMVSQDKALTGVAPEARLYSSAVGSLRNAGQPEECLAAQHVALRNAGDVRAINISFGEPLRRDPRSNPTLDGNALLTRCVDWSARVHNTLYVIAGNQGGGGIPIPTDNFNGVNVASTTRWEGEFRKLDFSNLSALPEGIGRRLILREINQGARRAINLVAPGNRIGVYDLEGDRIQVTGTSFAAPHVVGTVAVLQEYGDRQLKENAPNWTVASRRSEVMRAVLLNSADKIQDTGDGYHLGMTRTILAKDNTTWLQRDAYNNPAIPLDIQMGTGQLNAFRAYQQFSSGQWGPDTPVPAQGWDYNTLESGQVQDYVIDTPLPKGSYASVTLAWQRWVELNDQNGNGQFDLGEDFSDRGLNNLDVYLIPANRAETPATTCSSVSDVDSVEHIFCPVPETGRYKIRIVYHQQENQPKQDYALAWWTFSEE
ncbi:S8 family serine peptidase [Spirulina sp. CS-785/01]|uniref:S8 family serine peptidase n=1 Tax=Spirulina sp. CS-785/01 TaxID=3021716 RepID=UPI003FA68EA3